MTDTADGTEITNPTAKLMKNLNEWSDMAVSQPPKLTLEQRLLKAMAHVGRIEKEGKVSFAGTNYKYMSEEQVKVACQAACIEASVHPSCITVDIISDEWMKLRGKDHNLVKCRVTLDFRDGINLRSYQGIGSSADQGDKAYMQAQTGAIREAWKNAFIIPSGSDPEQNSPEDSQEGTQEAGKPTGPRASARAATKPQKGSQTPPLKKTQDQSKAMRALINVKCASIVAATQLCIGFIGTAPADLTKDEADRFIAHLSALPEFDGGAS